MIRRVMITLGILLSFAFPALAAEGAGEPYVKDASGYVLFPQTLRPIGSLAGTTDSNGNLNVTNTSLGSGSGPLTPIANLPGRTDSSGNLYVNCAGCTPTAPQTLSTNGIGVTSTDALILSNTTAAANGAQQWSGRLRLAGSAWNAATSTAQSMDWTVENQTTQGNAGAGFNGITGLTFSLNQAGGGFNKLFQLVNEDNGNYGPQGTQKNDGLVYVRPFSSASGEWATINTAKQTNGLYSTTIGNAENGGSAWIGFGMVARAGGSSEGQYYFTNSGDVGGSSNSSLVVDRPVSGVWSVFTKSASAIDAALHLPLTIYPGSANGASNQNGKSLTLAGGQGSGTGTGGSINFQTAPAGGSGSSANALVTFLTLDQAGHLVTGGSAPGIAGCGTGATISGNDIAGSVTLGTTPGTCVVTFNKAYTAAPKCFINNATSNSRSAEAITIGTTSFTIAADISVLTASDVINYHCIQ